MSRPAGRGRARRFSQAMTVARIRERAGATAVEVAFLESARLYTLRRDHPDFQRILAQLQEALAAQRAVAVTLASVDSDVIEDVQRP